MTEPKLRLGKISEFKPATENANKHTERGLRELEKSMNQDGYVAALTVAADGEALDGSARLEKSAEIFDEDVIVVEHDGKKPVVLVRTDIPNAKEDIAKRIAVRANRIAEIDLDWDVGELVSTALQVDLGRLWTKAEWDILVGDHDDEEDEDQGAEVENDGEIECPHCGYHFVPRS